MAQKSTPPVGPSSEMWGRLEVFVREPIQRFIQTLLEEEVTACLGCPKAARRGAVDAPAGMRNGYGRPRRLSLTAGTITVRRPRVRGLHERFVRRVLPLFKRRTREVGEQQPTAAEPRCGHHRITNVLDAVPRKYQAEARTLLRAMPYADTQAACEELRAPCDHRYRQLAPKAVERLGAPRHLLSVPAGTLAPPTDHECRRIALCGGATVHHSGQTLQEGGTATAMIWKVLQIAATTFQRLKAPELLPAGYAGVTYGDGIKQIAVNHQEIAARSPFHTS